MDLTLYEVANAVGVEDWVCRGGWTECNSILLRRCGDRLGPSRCRSDRSAVEIAAEHGLTAYDASYVAAARRHGWTLVSRDVQDLVSKGLAVAPDAAL